MVVYHTFLSIRCFTRLCIWTSILDGHLFSEIVCERLQSTTCSIVFLPYLKYLLNQLIVIDRVFSKFPSKLLLNPYFTLSINPIYRHWLMQTNRPYDVLFRSTSTADIGRVLSSFDPPFVSFICQFRLSACLLLQLLSPIPQFYTISVIITWVILAPPHIAQVSIVWNSSVV